MKQLIFALSLILMTFTVHATDKVAAEESEEEPERVLHRYELPSKEHKVFFLEVIDVSEPIAFPVRLNLTAYCPGPKKKEVKLWDRFEVCDFTKQVFSKEKNTIEVSYTLHTSKDGQVTCSIPRMKIFDLKTACK